MIVVRSTDLGDILPGALRSMLGVPEAELIVVIKRELDDGPMVPRATSVDLDGPLDEVRGGQVLSRTQEGDIPSVPVQPTTQSTTAPADALALPALAPVEHAAPAPSSDVNLRGYSFAQLEQMARDRRMELLRVGRVYTLQSAFGQRHYLALAQVVDAMRLRRYD